MVFLNVFLKTHKGSSIFVYGFSQMNNVRCVSFQPYIVRLGKTVHLYVLRKTFKKNIIQGSQHETIFFLSLKSRERGDFRLGERPIYSTLITLFLLLKSNLFTGICIHTTALYSVYGRLGISHLL